MVRLYTVYILFLTRNNDLFFWKTSEEENWNIEIALQELRCLTEALAPARDNANHYKIESEIVSSFRESKNELLTDVALARKHAAARLVRDKSVLQQTIVNMKVENSRAASEILFYRRFGPPCYGSWCSREGGKMGKEACRTVE